ncbi:GGDEF domain-containing protein [Helicovermis profundi]|uniref:GGDEF domain-containing protein n=1 Tax=Helicovermis profundi TaxID=3065157 RepID=A0AAU9ER87_9FIRM|nr:hypothetical protein HLPR_22020 [Clostridia bacterium S502]
MKFINPLLDYDESLKEKIRKQITFNNIKVLKVFAILSFFINLIIVAIYLKSNTENYLSSSDFIIRIFWVLSGFIYFFIVGKHNTLDSVTKKHKYIFLFTASLSLFYTALITASTISGYGYSSVFIINVMLSCTLFYFSFIEIVAVLLPSFIYIFFLISTMNTINLNTQNTFINIIAISLISVTYSTISYKRKATLIDYQEILLKNNKVLEHLSEFDGLTQIPNRRNFNKTFDLEWAHSIRESSPLSLIMIDVDDFKLYNDTYGHLAGDDCLKNLSSIFTKTLNREIDQVFRYGGEEFMVILPNTDLKGALKVADKIKNNISNENITHSKSIYTNITASIGLSSIIASPNDDKYALIENADKAMYNSKKNGKNQISYL